MGEFRMPSLGADMEAGTLVEWRVHVGDTVKHGDVVAEVETDKGIIDVEIFESGVIEEIRVKEGEEVPVGTVLAVIRTEGVAAPPPKAASPRPTPSPTPSATPVGAGPEAPQPTVPEPPVAEPAAPRPQPPPPAPPSSAPRARVSPRARKRAQDLGIDITTLQGSGPEGVITGEDVARVVRQPEVGSKAASPERQAAMRAAIGAAMARSKREIPHYYLATPIDMSRALAWLTERNEERPPESRLLSSVLLLRAVALAAGEVPEMNGFWIDGSFQPGNGVHVGVAISLRTGGLVAPAIHDVDEKGLDELMGNLLDLVKRARAGNMRSSEVTDPTITVTNLGDQGVESVFGVIYPPQVALVGFGKVTERPWASGGLIGARPLVTATLAADHRASDGHRGGRFLAAIDRLLQEPENL